jgi:hypothetical protein
MSVTALVVLSTALLTFDVERLFLSSDSKSRLNGSPKLFVAQAAVLATLGLAIAATGWIGVLSMLASGGYLTYSAKKRIAIAHEQRVAISNLDK